MTQKKRHTKCSMSLLDITSQRSCLTVVLMSRAGRENPCSKCQDRGSICVYAPTASSGLVSTPVMHQTRAHMAANTATWPESVLPELRPSNQARALTTRPSAAVPVASREQRVHAQLQPGSGKSCPVKQTLCSLVHVHLLCSLNGLLFSTLSASAVQTPGGSVSSVRDHSEIHLAWKFADDGTDLAAFHARPRPKRHWTTTDSFTVV